MVGVDQGHFPTTKNCTIEELDDAQQVSHDDHQFIKFLSQNNIIKQKSLISQQIPKTEQEHFD